VRARAGGSGRGSVSELERGERSGGHPPHRLYSFFLGPCSVVPPHADSPPFCRRRETHSSAPSLPDPARVAGVSPLAPPALLFAVAAVCVFSFLFSASRRACAPTLHVERRRRPHPPAARGGRPCVHGNFVRKEKTGGGARSRNATPPLPPITPAPRPSLTTLFSHSHTRRSSSPPARRTGATWRRRRTTGTCS